MGTLALVAPAAEARLTALGYSTALDGDERW
jgi:hypothetical protein